MMNDRRPARFNKQYIMTMLQKGSMRKGTLEKEKPVMSPKRRRRYLQIKIYVPYIV